MHIVMTGATAGFGLFAASTMVAAGHDLTIGARTPGNLPPGISSRVRAKPLDLDSLDNVRRFAAAVGDEPILVGLPDCEKHQRR
jgi:NAD(P)-dependent dehydrogenase (short-subunit alcohol dehydrogenase family)